MSSRCVPAALSATWVGVALMGGCSQQRVCEETAAPVLPEGAIRVECPVRCPNVEFFRVARPTMVLGQGILFLSAHGWRQDYLPDLGVGSPRERFEGLFAQADGHRREIRQVSDFRWLVHIKSTQDALAYVQFLSDPAICYLIGFEFIELKPSTEDSREYGGVAATDWDRLGLQPPQVSAVPGGFITQRYLLRDDPWVLEKPQEIVLAEEFVGEDGLYLRRIKRVVPKEDCPFIRAPYFL